MCNCVTPECQSAVAEVHATQLRCLLHFWYPRHVTAKQCPERRRKPVAMACAIPLHGCISYGPRVAYFLLLIAQLPAACHNKQELPATKNPKLSTNETVHILLFRLS